MNTPTRLDRMSKILAIDPGERAGYAFAIDGIVQASGTVKAINARQALTTLEHYEPGILVIENQYMPRPYKRKPVPGKKRKPPGVNFPALQTLIYRRHIWDIQAEIHGVQVEVVDARDWESYFGLTRKPSKEDRAQHKERIRRFAELAEGHTVDADECDALLMLRYYQNTRSF